MMLYGKVLWWSDKNENGVIVDSKGNEFYFDRSVISPALSKKVKRNMYVTFECNTRIKTCLCAKKVGLLSATKRSQVEVNFNQEHSEVA